MSCETCTHTLHSIECGTPDSRVSWCPRCGTLKIEVGKPGTPEADQDSHPPMLVVRARKMHDAEASGNYDAGERAVRDVYEAVGRIPPT